MTRNTQSYRLFPSRHGRTLASLRKGWPAIFIHGKMESPTPDRSRVEDLRPVRAVARTGRSAHPPARPVRVAALLCAGVGALAVAACTHDALVAPKPAHDAPYLAVALACTVNVSTLQTSCGQSATGMAHSPREAIAAARAKVQPTLASSLVSTTRAVIIGGQGTYVQLTWSNNQYNSSTQIFSQDATVQDLTTEPFGTTNGVTADTMGIRVFFDSLPVVTTGSGTVTVANASGTGTYTSTTPQPYFQYAAPLPSNGTTAQLLWQFNCPPTATQFTYFVYVVTRLPTETVQAITSIPAHAFSLLAAGQSHSCAVRPGNFAYCWGFDDYGAIGSGNSASPALVPLGTLTTQTFGSVAAGAEFSCGLNGKTPYCWGDNSRGEVGDGTLNDRGVPTAVAGNFSFTQIVGGSEFACGLASSGVANCWGANSMGQLGDGGTGDLNAPTSGAPVAGGHVFVSLAAGAFHACGLISSGTAYCWGSNTAGALGQSADSSAHVSPVAIGGQTFSALAAGDNFTCGLGTDSNVYCWGSNTYGSLGDGTQTSRSTVSPVSASGVTFATLTAGANHACAATSGGATYCWGDNFYGQLGTGTSTGSSNSQLLVATAVSGGPFAFTTLAAGFSHTCALTGSGAAYCWGDDEVGQLGNGSTSMSTTPVAVSLP